MKKVVAIITIIVDEAEVADLEMLVKEIPSASVKAKTLIKIEEME